MPPLCEIYLPHPPHQLKTSSVILSVKPAPRAGPSSQPRDLGCDQTRISILTTQRQPSANLHRQYVWGFQHLGPAGAFEQDVAFSSTVFRRRNILRKRLLKCGGTPSSQCG